MRRTRARTRARTRTITAVGIALSLGAAPSSGTLAGAQQAPADSSARLRDRGTGVATSMFGTYARRGELLVYPFVEVYRDANTEYKPSDFGYASANDYRGKLRATEWLLFVGYGLGRDVEVEAEAAVIGATLTKSPSDPTAMPRTFHEGGLGDVEGQVRWRFARETERHPEGFAYYEVALPLQRRRKLIGTQAWEHKLGVAVTRGYGFGTVTLRAAVESVADEGRRKIEAGEYAVEYLRRLSPRWRVVAVLEGSQLDEVELIPEVQWRFRTHAFLKANLGIGLTPNATDLGPEVGVMISR